MSGDFNPEQKRYLEGFVTGLQIARSTRGQGAAPTGGTAEPTGPDAEHWRAQARVLKAGGKLSEQEKFKRELHPFDGYQRLKAQAANGNGHAYAQAVQELFGLDIPEAIVGLGQTSHADVTTATWPPKHQHPSAASVHINTRGH